MTPLRSYLFLLTPRLSSAEAEPLLHYVLEESSARAAQMCRHSHPDHRIVSMRDVTDAATAA